jgi:hypothetical protein
LPLIHPRLPPESEARLDSGAPPPLNKMTRPRYP